MKVLSMDEILTYVKETTEVEIVNKSWDSIPLFDVPIHQPFKFGVEIVFNSIKEQCSFQMHFPSLYIKANDVMEFYKTIGQVASAIETLNAGLKNNYSSEWVLQ
jgi:hypothetical protein